MKVNKTQAELVLKKEAELATAGNVSAGWVELMESFSEICQGASKTHIAFLGTAMLAKAVSREVDVFAVKAGAGGPGAYSARGLGHGVLVPHATGLGINLGVTGREPLNNQPYFQISRVSRDITVHGSAKPIIAMLCDILDRLASVQTEEEAREALRSFIYVRRKYQPKYLEAVASVADISSDRLVLIVETFVKEDSEGGKRAQAVVAGLMDLFAGPGRVQTGRINDPDRHLPGDVGVRSTAEEYQWERVLEVRDKPVTIHDVLLFARKAREAGVEEAAVIAVSSNQPAIDFEEARVWARERGLALSLFIGWRSFIEQALFWSEQPQTKGPSLAMTSIYERLLELEVSESGVEAWLAAVTSTNERN